MLMAIATVCISRTLFLLDVYITQGKATITFSALNFVLVYGYTGGSGVMERGGGGAIQGRAYKINFKKVSAESLKNHRRFEYISLHYLSQLDYYYYYYYYYYKTVLT